jgi:hypothetical protein
MNPGKRARAQAEIWEPVKNVAQALWAENSNLLIAEVIRRIQGMTIFKASIYTESAIRKRIAKLAPAGANKPGRPPKKHPT